MIHANQLMAILMRMVFLVIGFIIPSQLMAQESSALIRLQCDGTEKSQQDGYAARPEKVERSSFSVAIDPRSGLGSFSGLTPFSRVISFENGPYKFLVMADAFLWGEKGTSRDNPIFATSDMKIDRYSGAMTLSEVLVSQVRGREYIYLKNVQASCTPLTDRKF